jgi:murein DD-endopeptidase MepM/ murein hydrolase activator NlpD
LDQRWNSGLDADPKKNDREGYKVKVRHGDGSLSIYMHLDGQQMPKVGTPVTPSSVIGRVGKTGNVPKDGDAHLHLQIYDRDGGLLMPNVDFQSPPPL